MGANPRANVACSHTPASIGARGCIESVQLNQNGERSSLGNVVSRLGQETELRDTLNRRRDQEWSKQSTTHKGHPEVVPGRRGEILIEDLCHAIVTMKENDVELITTATKSLFNPEIREARVLEGFKLPAIKAYEGKSDP